MYELGVRSAASISKFVVLKALFPYQNEQIRDHEVPIPKADSIKNLDELLAAETGAEKRLQAWRKF